MMSLKVLISAAEAKEKKATEAEKDGRIAIARSNYKGAADFYLQASEADATQRAHWLNKANECGDKAEELATVKSQSKATPTPEKRYVSSAPEPEKKPETEKSKVAASGDGKPSVEKALDELSKLVGLGTIKKQVRDWVSQVKMFKEREALNLPVPDISYHMVFTGNPGTGKTTVARIMAEIYSALGIISKGNLVEVKRGDLVAEHIGGTAVKTQAKIDEAIGGVLFIDEAYSLAGTGNDFGKEAIETILVDMENHRDDLVVIVAGYTDLMKNFMNSNPGLASRFSNYLEFEDYDGDEMNDIFLSLCAKDSYVIEPETEGKLKLYFKSYYENRDANFGNARDVRKLYEKALTNQTARLALQESRTKEDHMHLSEEDMPFLKDFT